MHEIALLSFHEIFVCVKIRLCGFPPLGGLPLGFGVLFGVVVPDGREE